MRCIIALTILALLAMTAQAAKFSEEEAFTQFLSFTHNFDKKYKNMEEFVLRFNNFKASMIKIEALNAVNPGSSVYGITKFSDLSADEFKDTYLGFKSSLKSTTHHHHHKKSSVEGAAANVTSYDWRDHGAVTPVKDQQQCGSCWAFSTVEEIESSWFLAGNKLIELSPQQIVSCDTTDGGCNGGDTTTAYAYVKQAGGLELESSYPYTSGGGDSGTCKFDKTKIVSHISGFSYATTPCTDSCNKQNEDTLLDNLVAKGPVSICVDAESWQFYSSGVITSSCPHAYSDLDHCVQLVGFNKAGTTPYYIIRNSWNTDWGEAGYLYVEIGKNLCGVADEATIAEI